jgi:DNA repair exonuclease SbcCD ATPase subunit
MEDVIDTRDLQERIEELEEFQTYVEDIKEELAEHKDELAQFEKELEELRVEESDENLSEREREVVDEKIERVGANIEILTEDIESLEDDLESAEVDFGEQEQTELADLNSLKEEIPEWHSGNQLIHESHFTDYAQQLCEDIGDVPKDLPHYIVLDWEATAENIKADYSECTHDGETYLYRNC